jgi:hypothetical protein
MSAVTDVLQTHRQHPTVHVLGVRGPSGRGLLVLNNSLHFPAPGASGGPVPEPDPGGAHVTRGHDIFLRQERGTAAPDIGPNHHVALRMSNRGLSAVFVSGSCGQASMINYGLGRLTWVGGRGVPRPQLTCGMCDRGVVGTRTLCVRLPGSCCG